VKYITVPGENRQSLHPLFFPRRIKRRFLCPSDSDILISSFPPPPLPPLFLSAGLKFTVDGGFRKAERDAPLGDGSCFFFPSPFILKRVKLRRFFASSFYFLFPFFPFFLFFPSPPQFAVTGEPKFKNNKFGVTRVTCSENGCGNFVADLFFFFFFFLPLFFFPFLA